MTDPSPHLFWITSRAAGTTALLLSSATVAYGLAMAARAKARPGGMAARRTIHEALALSVMGAIAVHGLSLLGDGYLHASFLDVTVPFVGSYKTLWTSVGIISGWATVLLGLSFYARERIGRARFKLIHRLTVVAWLGGIVHSLAEGSDAGQVWFLALVAITILPAAGMLALRLAGATPPPGGGVAHHLLDRARAPRDPAVDLPVAAPSARCALDARQPMKAGTR